MPRNNHHNLIRKNPICPLQKFPVFKSQSLQTEHHRIGVSTRIISRTTSARNKSHGSSLVTNSFLLDDRRPTDWFVVQSTDAEALLSSLIGRHVLLDEVGQLALFRQHRQERRDELVVVVSSPAVVNLQQR